MLLGFYDRHGNGLAVELTPEMAKAIASKAVDISATIKSFSCFDSALEIRLGEYSLYEILHAQDSAYPAKTPCDDFFTLPKTFKIASSGRKLWATGVWIDVQMSRAIGGEPTVFWEFYGSSYELQCTPSLSLAQLHAIANNQPLPQE